MVDLPTNQPTNQKNTYLCLAMVNLTETVTPMVQIKGSVLDCVWTPEFDMRHLKKSEEHIDRNVVRITIKMRSRVRIFKEIIIIKLYLRNFDEKTLSIRNLH